MGIGDKISNAAEDFGGKAKEAAGNATDNDSLKAEGQKDQVVADAKKVGEGVKDGAVTRPVLLRFRQRVQQVHIKLFDRRQPRDLRASLRLDDHVLVRRVRAGTVTDAAGHHR